MKSLFSGIFLIFISQTVLAYRPISDDRRAELLSQFNYVPNVQIVKLPASRGCAPQDFEYNTTYPQRETPYNIKARAYIPNMTGAPVVFMLPPLGGSNQLDTAMASNLCSHNIAAILVLNDFTGLNAGTLMPVEDHDHTPRRVASAIKGGIAVLKSSVLSVNTDKVGLFGASLGGILGSIAYGVLPEISAASFIVNGGDVPNTLAYSDQAPIIRIKKGRMAEVGLKTDAEYETYLNEHITLDPLHFAPYIAPESIKLYLSRTDNSVPSANQMAFYKAVGSPKETVFYDLSHALTIFAVLGISDEKNQISNWFLKRFELPNPRAATLQ
jgi:hypothetical protein